MTGRHKGYCFIEMNNPVSAQNCVTYMNGLMLGGRFVNMPLWSLDLYFEIYFSASLASLLDIWFLRRPIKVGRPTHANISTGAAALGQHFASADGLSLLPSMLFFSPFSVVLSSVAVTLFSYIRSVLSRMTWHFSPFVSSVFFNNLFIMIFSYIFLWSKLAFIRINLHSLLPSNVSFISSFWGDWSCKEASHAYWSANFSSWRWTWSLSFFLFFMDLEISRS